eukprot:TRINITY_DN67018_c0_g1_i5.p1 TRINITY_DN67018_c0_g1~~TRINITY_DN67018_c0_g1_i5.p1  ORF type:complete len:929 (-),score=106.67 TRINITY_DN67018_c0_g1_i5:190-2976(-)
MVPIRRNYAFERADIPRGYQYVMKIRYPAHMPELPFGLEGKHFITFLHARQSVLEAFQLKRKVKGPIWLKLINPEEVKAGAKVSWCALEYELTQGFKSVQLVEKQPPPPLLTAISLQVYVQGDENDLNFKVGGICLICSKRINPDVPWDVESWKQHKDQEITAIVNRDANITNKTCQGKVIEQIGERATLSCLLSKMLQLDPDIIVGHRVDVDIERIIQRMQQYKLSQWSQIGRLKRTKYTRTVMQSLTIGRLLCDTQRAAQDSLREVDYSLNSLARGVLQFNRSTPLGDSVPQLEQDCWLVLGLMHYLQVIQLSKQLASLGGCQIQTVLEGKRAKRVEMLLLHEFYSKKFMLPDLDKEKEVKSKNKGPQYSGGLVLEPVPGLYEDFVLLLDFNSLYPSIIQEFNICFTTIACANQENELPQLPPPATELALLPSVIAGLVQARRQVKQKLKKVTNQLAQRQLDIRQQALKLTANSMYGCLGFSNSRFYAKPMAQLITQQGREILQQTVRLVEGTFNLKVIYGDTDSIMVNTRSRQIQESLELGSRIQAEVNKRFKLLELGLDGIFKRILLLKKKKYAAVKMEPGPSGQWAESHELKGLDLVRRDWSALSKECGKFVLDQILSDNQRDQVVEEIHNYLRQVDERLNTNDIPYIKFAIHKQLTKNPQEYPDAKSLPHVQVAIRKGIPKGQMVPYIICESKEEGKSALADRAYHLDEVQDESLELKIDMVYYRSQQIHPLVARLCKTLDGTDDVRIAECLGLNTANYKASAASRQLTDTEADNQSSQAQFQGCDPLTLNLTQEENVQISPNEMGNLEKYVSVSGTSQPRKLSQIQLYNQVCLNHRKAIREYYNQQNILDNYSKSDYVQDIRLDLFRGGNAFEAQINDKQLYMQLQFYKQLVQKYPVCSNISKFYLDFSGYRWIDLSELIV